MSNSAINKLNNLLFSLKTDCQQIDSTNAKHKTHTLLENSSLFSINLFKTQSEKFFPYLQEIQQNIKELDYLLIHNKNDFAYSLLNKIEQQLNAIRTAFTSMNVIHKEANLKQQVIQKRRYENIAKKVMLSSHELYKKLSEYHEFERRLLDMLNEKNNLLNQAKKNQIEKITEEALIIHQRLGRCRQAISKVERQIETNEKKDLR